MRRAIQSLLAIATFLTMGCRDMGRGECNFHSPTALIKLDRFEDFPYLVRRHGDPNALLLVTDVGEPITEPMDALRIDLASGRQTVDKVPTPDQSGREPDPPGYTFFLLDPGLIQRPVAHPLVRSGTLRVDFRGGNSATPVVGIPGGAIDNRIRVVRKDRYTGTLAVMFGQRKLFEQRLVNYTHVPALNSYVAIEPDGDRIVCLCNDDRGSWLAVFESSTLAAEQQRAPK